MSDKELNKKIMILPILAIIFSVLGATFAYFQSSVTGSNNVNALSYKFDVTLNVALVNPSTAPSKGYGLIPLDETNIGTAITNNCIDSNGYAACRIYELTFTNNSGQAVTLNGTLTPSSNFANLKYSVTTVGGAKSSLTAGNALPNAPVTTGFQNLTIPVNTSKMYVMLYVNNLNANQPNDQGKTFNGTLTLVDASGGNQLYAIFDMNNYVYTTNITETVYIGQQISSNITKYYDPNGSTKAITALEAAYSTANSGTTTSLPFFLRHNIGNGTLWCLIEYKSGVETGESYCIFSTQSDCNSEVSNWSMLDYTYSCASTTVTNGVLESYAGFVVNPAMATANSGMIAGTYYLKGGDNGAAYNTNKTTLITAFGNNNCNVSSSGITCNVSNLNATASQNGTVAINNSYPNCYLDARGFSYCGFDG